MQYYQFILYLQRRYIIRCSANANKQIQQQINKKIL